MLDVVLTDMLEKLITYRQDHQDEPEDIEIKLDDLEYDIKWLLRILEKSRLKKIA